MEQKNYSCDGGSIAIGTPTCRANFTNDYGDGCFTVYVVDYEESRTFTNKDFKGSVEGESITVYSCDWLSAEDCENEENILFELSGRFGVYAMEGDILLVRW